MKKFCVQFMRRGTPRHPGDRVGWEDHTCHRKRRLAQREAQYLARRGYKKVRLIEVV